MKYLYFTFFVIFLHLANEIRGSSDDLYNTYTDTSLDWKTKEGDEEWYVATARDEQGNIIGDWVGYHQICSYPATKEGTFIRSTYIKAKDAERVKIEVTFSMKCFNEKNCSDTFAVYYYQADGDIANSTFPPWNESSYDKIDTLTAERNVDETKSKISHQFFYY